MQQSQRNYALTIICAILLAGSPALAANTKQTDVLLTGAPGPCDPKLDGPDYVAETDADGNPVAPADLSHPNVPLPEGMLLPLGGQAASNRPQAMVALNQKRMDSILNPAPACPPDRKRK